MGEEGGLRVTCALTHTIMHTHLYTPCGTAVNHNLVELAQASRELGRIIYGGEQGRWGEERWVEPVSLDHIRERRWDPLSVWGSASPSIMGLTARLNYLESSWYQPWWWSQRHNEHLLSPLTNLFMSHLCFDYIEYFIIYTHVYKQSLFTSFMGALLFLYHHLPLAEQCETSGSTWVKSPESMASKTGTHS